VLSDELEGFNVDINSDDENSDDENSDDEDNRSQELRECLKNHMQTVLY
jgi:hypothetical protein